MVTLWSYIALSWKSQWFIGFTRLLKTLISPPAAIAQWPPFRDPTEVLRSHLYFQQSTRSTAGTRRYITLHHSCTSCITIHRKSPQQDRVLLLSEFRIWNGRNEERSIHLDTYVAAYIYIIKMLKPIHISSLSRVKT